MDGPQRKLEFQETKVKKGRAKRRSSVNDLDLSNWKELTKTIYTDSLWILPERDKSGAHDGEYHGNFIPQIPRQAMLRFTKRGEAVLNPFLGSGTTLGLKELGRLMCPS